MENPILQMIYRQNEISRILRNPNEVYNEMMNSDPDFRKFVEENKNKSIEQMARDYNVNPNFLQSFIR